MDPQTFENRFREQIREILNRLQAAVAVSAQLERTLTDIGDAVQTLSHEVEDFLAEQRPGS